MAIRRENTALLRAQADPPPAASAEQPVTTRADAALVAPRALTLRRTRSGVIGMLWLVIGGGVLAYGGTLLYANISRVEVDSAVVTGTIHQVRAPAAGTVTVLALHPGAAFSAGDTLFTIRNPELDQTAKLAEIGVERARHTLRQRESEWRAELSRRENFLLRARAEMQRIAVEVEALTEIDRSSRARYDIAQRLFTQGIGTRLRLEEAAEKAADARANLARERIKQIEREELLNALIAGYGHGASEVVVRLADAEAAMRRAQAEVELESAELDLRQGRRADMDIKASASGRVLRILRLDGSQVLAGDVVALVERGDERFIHAFMTQAEVGRISVGDEADVLLPAQRLSAKARVVAVERSGAYLDDVESRYRWSLSRDMGQRLTDRDRSARVTLRFGGADHAAAQRLVDLGTPAVISFERRWQGGPLFAAFAPLASPADTGPANGSPRAVASAGTGSR